MNDSSPVIRPVSRLTECIDPLGVPVFGPRRRWEGTGQRRGTTGSRVLTFRQHHNPRSLSIPYKRGVRRYSQRKDEYRIREERVLDRHRGLTESSVNFGRETPGVLGGVNVEWKTVGVRVCV